MLQSSAVQSQLQAAGAGMPAPACCPACPGFAGPVRKDAFSVHHLHQPTCAKSMPDCLSSSMESCAYMSSDSRNSLQTAGRAGGSVSDTQGTRAGAGHSRTFQQPHRRLRMHAQKPSRHACIMSTGLNRARARRGVPTQHADWTSAQRPAPSAPEVELPHAQLAVDARQVAVGVREGQPQLDQLQHVDVQPAGAGPGKRLQKTHRQAGRQLNMPC